MSMHGHGGPMGGRSRDARVQRELNASAPEIPHLLRRTAGLFAPFRAPLIATGVLVITSAGLTVIPPLLIEVAFNQGLFPEAGGPNLS